MVFGELLQGADGQAARAMRIDTGDHRCGRVREIARRILGIDHAPQVRLEVAAGLACDLVGDA